jgi:hypothetical protein
LEQRKSTSLLEVDLIQWESPHSLDNHKQ